MAARPGQLHATDAVVASRRHCVLASDVDDLTDA
jgi:hypothetical protein